MSRKRTGREGLLVWLQSRTSGYKNVNVVDFTDSWVDGMAFCALLHSFFPELVKYEELTPAAKAQNLELAFSLAEKLGIPRLIEPADMLLESGPDKFFVITYLAQFVDHFRHQDEHIELEGPPTNTIKQFEALSTSKLREAEHKKRVRSHITRCIDRVNMVKGGKVSGTIKQLTRKPSLPRIQHEAKRGGTVTDRVEEFNRKTGSQTKHISGDQFISERIPTGLVADRIAAFLKMQAQIQLDIEFIMISSPKVRRTRRSSTCHSRSSSDGQMSSIYYIMRQNESSPTSSPDQEMNEPQGIPQTIQPLAL